MPDNNAIAESWLVAELGSALAAVFETMTGARPSPETGSPGKLPSSEGVLLRQPFQGIAGEYWVFAPAASVSSSAKLVLEAAGMEDDDPETSKSTYLETVNQGLSGLAQSMSGKFEREITASSGSEQTSAPDLKWIPVTLAFPASSVTLYCAASPELCSQFEAVFGGSPAAAAASASEDDNDGSVQLAKSKTFGLLLDVELPVSVSFGRAQVPLREVLKLTTGSIVELNRSITEPVEVIVNNCVIARGEVVVVEGNFGIRVQQVVSRQERLRTLN